MSSREPDVEGMSARLRSIEQRLDALEHWQSRAGVAGTIAPRSLAESARDEVAKPGAADDPVSFDLALVGRTLIVLGGAYLLRALTESGIVPISAGIALGLAYAVTWSLLALRPSVRRTSAVGHGMSTVFTGMPLVFEATRRFHVFGDRSAALVLAVLTAVVFVVAWRRQLEAVAWTFMLMGATLAPMLMLETRSVVPFVLYLAALGVGTVWLGYEFEWTLVRAIVAFEVDVAVFVLAFLVVTGRLPRVMPETAIAVSCLVFAAYLSSFAVRTLVRQREAVPFEVVQTLALLVCAIGGAMWVAASRSTLEIPLAAAMIGLGAASYAVSFAFIPRRFATPRNFVLYSSLALMLIVCGGGFIAHGLASSVVFSGLAIASVVCAIRFRKSSLALHAAVYLCAGFVGAGLVQIAARALLLRVTDGWPVPPVGSLLLLAACVAAAAMRPIERQGSFELWTVAKVAILAELGCILATLSLCAIGLLAMNVPQPDAAVVSVARTAVLATLTVLTAWATRFATFSPGRHLCNALMIALGAKLVVEDFRVARPATLFVALAIVGVALILTPRFRRHARPPQAEHPVLALTPPAPA